MKRDIMFSTKITDYDQDIIDQAGKGNRYKALQKLIFSYIDSDSERKETFDKIEHMQKIIDDKSAVIKYQRDMIDRLQKRLGEE